MTDPERLSTQSELGNTQVKSARSIQEFWIDFLLEEEFRVDPGFVASFVTYVIPGTTSREVEKVVHFMTDKYREADLAVFFEAWQRAMARSKLVGVTPHTLRHFYASVAGDLGFTEFTIAALLGQSAGSVTSRYVRHLDNVLISAADKVAEAVYKMMIEDKNNH